MPFFESLGFHLPERKGIADFLQEVTSEKDQKVPALDPADLMHSAKYTHLESKSASIARLASLCLPIAVLCFQNCRAQA